MATLLRKAASTLRRRFKPRKVVRLEDPMELAALTYWAEKKPLRIEMPVQMLRMQGAFVYGPRHPFVQALDNGRDALAAFYEGLQPQTVAQYYGLDGADRKGADLPPWELPWYLRAARTPPPGELSLGADHGVSFYGPASEQKIDLEMSRLTKLTESIKRDGYDPDAHGDIEGYVLRSGTDACFFVRGGKHRAAVLAHLGHSHIPVSFRQGFPRLIDPVQAQLWPLVRSGDMDIGVAQEILRAYTSANPNKDPRA
jgi:hypothetical protein